MLAPNPILPKKLKIEVIDNKKDWDAFLSSVGLYDTYHTYDYHMLSKSDTETPILLKYQHLDVLIGIPFLVRYIDNTDCKDLTSVYGYTGPISKGVTEGFDNTNFKKELVEFLKTNNYVSAFSRLNPYIPNQSKILHDLGSITTRGKVVNIDISKNLEAQRANYQSRLKTYVNKCRRNCTISMGTTEKDLKEFIDIYHENMRRVNASNFYFFDELYFQNLVDSKDFDTQILFAVDKETKETMAGCLYMISNGIVQYHLSGAKNKFLDRAPTKLLIDELRITATENGHKFLNLGGGIGGSQDDSLFVFKSSFSKDYKNFNLWKLIINKDMYNELVFKTGTFSDSEYFPLYRSIK